MYKLYATSVIFRNRPKPLSSLGPGSHIKISMVCPDCTSAFTRHAFILFSTGNFLCQSCSLKDKHTKELIVGSSYERLTVVYKINDLQYSMLCDCGTECVKNKYSLLQGTSKSCGCLKSERLKQFRIDNKDFQKGENHPNWKGGISSDRGRVMATSEYKEWRMAVFTRDNFKCTNCLSNSNELEAHHIEGYASNIEKVMLLSNGITFCKKCHKKFHSSYGNKNINLSKINEFNRLVGERK